MKKGKFGLCLWVYAAVAFVLAVMEELVPCLLLVGFVITAERDEWAIKQVLQALFLCLGSMIIKIIPSALVSVLAGSPFLGGMVSAMFYVFNVLVFLTSITLALIGIVNAVRGVSTGVPVLSKLANKAFGIAQSGVYYQSPQK